MSELNIPNNWCLPELGEILDIQGGSQPPKSHFKYEPQDGYIRLLQIRDFGEKPVPTYVPLNKVSKFCVKEDVLIARYGASLGRIVTGMEGAYNVALAKVINENQVFNSRYLFYLLKTPILQTPLAILSRSAQNGFAKHEIAHIKLPLPPLAEQHRIVAKIEVLFSELDKGTEALKTAQEQLKVYRQAVLKYAFEGKLTNPDVKEGELPEGWLKKSISDVVIKSTMKAYPDKNSDLQFLGMDSIEPNSTKPHIFYKFSEMKSAGNLFTSNQVLYGRMRPYLNKVWVANCEGVASGEFIVMSCKETMLPQYLLNILHHQDFVNFANSKTSGDRPRISYDEVSEFEFIVPPIKEQYSVITEIESRLSVCNKIEESIEQGLKQAETLRQCILKSAFEGKLVHQDPNDEPASVLLERIKAERAASNPMKKTRKTKEKA